MSLARSFVGRQPIFDRSRRIVAFELLFRNAPDADGAGVTDGSAATRELLRSAFVDIGIERLVGPHRAFINLTRDLLRYEVLAHLPRDKVVLEILEDIELDADLVDTIRHLKASGFVVALDDYAFDASHHDALALVDIVKVDVLALSSDALSAQVTALRRYRAELLAEKIEDGTVLQRCLDLGFAYFQGYFLSRPQTVEGARLAREFGSFATLIGLLNNADSTLDDLLDAIRADARLAAEVLRVANTPAFHRGRAAIDSLRHAVVTLGRATLTRVVLLLEAGRGVDPETLRAVLVRARFVELYADPAGHAEISDRFFVAGLISQSERLFGVRIEQMLQHVRVQPDLVLALLRGEGPIGQALQSAHAFERPDDAVPIVTPVARPVLERLYLEAMRWSEDVVSTLTHRTSP